MKISIDISDKTEVAAAIPLLQLLLGYNFTAAADAGSPVAVQAQDAAAAFGAAPLPPVLSTVGVTPQPTAPVVQPLSFQPPSDLSAFVPPVPVAAAPLGTAAPSASGVELDSEGLPWDDRIHAGTKTKTVPGMWKAKKGVNDAAYVNGVKAELRARMASGQPAAVQHAAQVFAGVAEAIAQPVAAGVLPPLGAGPFVPPAAFSPPAPAAAPSTPATFEEFMQRITVACSGGVVPMEAVNAAVAAYQLPSITSLQTNQTYVPHVWQYLQSQHPTLA